MFLRSASPKLLFDTSIVELFKFKFLSTDVQNIMLIINLKLFWFQKSLKLDQHYAVTDKTFYVK